MVATKALAWPCARRSGTAWPGQHEGAESRGARRGVSGHTEAAHALARTEKPWPAAAEPGARHARAHGDHEH